MLLLHLLILVKKYQMSSTRVWNVISHNISTCGKIQLLNNCNYGQLQKKLGQIQYECLFQHIKNIWRTCWVGIVANRNDPLALVIVMNLVDTDTIWLETSPCFDFCGAKWESQQHLSKINWVTWLWLLRLS